MNRLRSLIPGLFILALGVLCTYNLFQVREDRILFLPTFTIFLGPTLLVAGLAICILRGIAGPGASKRGILLLSGLLMMLVGGFPWIYTPWLMGDRPGGEAAGMMGTLIFIFVGFPGLMLALISFFLRRLE
jgi:hypothetical protein